MRSILACFAHPDDETFAAGATLAHYASQGVEVTLVCATRGEAGKIADPSLATPDNLGEVREQELRAAAARLGVSRVEFLGYRDSGMADTEDNADPRSYLMSDRGEVIARLVGYIRSIRPDIVLTFDPDGAYGHPDHITIHHHTLAAVAAARDETRYPEAGEPWTPRRLFFTAISKSWFAQVRRRLDEAGVDTSAFDRPDMPIVGLEDDEIDVIMELPDMARTKMDALLCHATQAGPENFAVQLAGGALGLMGTEFFTMWWGAPLPDGDHSDLFAGL